MHRKKKYIMTRKTLVLPNGKRLYRIRAIKSMPEIKVYRGDLGGWVEGKHNLSQNGRCWIFGDAKVYDKAVVRDDAYVLDNALVFEQAIIEGNALVMNSAVVCGNAIIAGGTWIEDRALVYGDAMIDGACVQIRGDTIAGSEAQIHKNAYITSNAMLEDYLARHVSALRKNSDKYARSVVRPGVDDDLPFF
ncbi:hypothetical protein IJG04_01660 [Candidatus Saccharibacteria bacterium]|nr:hypothetical protein [Candidatus Saccharibacteria bacterium]